MKKGIIILLAVFIVSFLFVSCKSTTTETTVAEATTEAVISATETTVAETTAKKELTTVIWGLESFLTALPHLAARELGYFEEEGVDIQFRFTSMGWQTLDQIIGQDVDMGMAANWALVCRMGQPNLGCGGLAFDYNVPVALMVSKDIEKLSDLKGKKLAAITGSLWDYFSAKALSAGGLTGADVTICNFDSPVDYLSAAVRKDIDAGWFFEINLIKAKEILGPLGWHPLVTGEDVVPGAAKGWSTLPLSLKAAAEKPEAIAGAIKAYKRGADWIKGNPEEAAKLASKLMGMSVEDAAIMIPYYGFTVGITKLAIEKMVDMKEEAIKAGIITEIMDYDIYKKFVLGPVKLVFPEMIEEGVMELINQ